MAERYTRVFTLNSNLYAKGSPLIILAGALLHDTQTEDIIAQLKFSSVINKEIVSISIRIFPRDIASRSLGEPVTFSYLDLKIQQGEVFGSKIPVKMPENTTREFAVEVFEVVFSDKTVWCGSNDKWEAIPNQTELSTEFDSHVIDSFKSDFGISAQYKHLEYKDLLFCVCGAVNNSNQAECYCCKTKLNTIISLDYNEYANQKIYESALSSSKSENVDSILDALSIFEDLSKCRDCSKEIDFCNSEIDRLNWLAEEKRIQQEKEAESERKEAERIAKRNKKIALITTPIVCAVIAFIIVLNAVIIPNNNYNDAIALMDAGNIVEAYEALVALDGYKDSIDKASSIYARYEVEKVKVANVGDYVFFGAYEQDNNTSNGKEDVEWLVLEIKDGKALVISKYALDCKSYNTSFTDVTWETCTLRKWLNNDFINAAFSADEKAMIPTVTVSADKNPNYSTNPGNATQDQVFLLSITEVNKYFSSDSARQCKPTDCAVANGAYVNSSNGKCWWWLRSPGRNQFWAANVGRVGYVHEYGTHVSTADIAVRPALWIDLGGGV